VAVPRLNSEEQKTAPCCTEVHQAAVSHPILRPEPPGAPFRAGPPASQARGSIMTMTTLIACSGHIRVVPPSQPYNDDDDSGGGSELRVRTQRRLIVEERARAVVHFRLAWPGWPGPVCSSERLDSARLGAFGEARIDSAGHSPARAGLGRAIMMLGWFMAL
jgi:hypothetical protein